jgi:MFS family permease
VPGFSRLLTDVTPLRESAQFRRLWIGTTLSSIGSALGGFAVPLQVYDITRSSFAVGAIGVATVLPTITIGMFGGSLADSVDRRKLVLATTCGQAAVSAALAAQAFAAVSSVWLLYALIALSSALSAVNGPARRTFVPTLLPPDKLSAGLALNRVTFQLMLTVGPALGGVITAAAGGHLQACYLVDAISFGASLYGVARLPAMPPKPGAARPGPRAVVAGLQFLRHSPVLAGAFLADLNATVFGLPLAVFPAINAERFGGNPTTLGLFTAAIGVGGLVSSALTGPVGRLRRQGVTMLCMVAIWGAAFAGFALARPLWLVLTLLAVAGAADTFTVVIRGTIVQAVVTDEFRGRLTAAEYVISAGGDSLGRLESGAVGSLTTPTISALSGGLLTVVLAGVISLALPAFARYRAGEATAGADLPGSPTEEGTGPTVPPAATTIATVPSAETTVRES